MPVLIQEMTFEPEHRFYDEAIHFCSVWLAESAVSRLVNATEAGQAMHAALTSIKAGTEFNFTGPAATPNWVEYGTMTLSNNDCPMFVCVQNCTPIFDFLCSRTETRPTICFSLNEYLPGEIDAQVDMPLVAVSQRDLHPRLNEKVCQLIIASAFETNHRALVSEFGRFNPANRPVWPVEMQFFRHLRHGCFHGNNFNIMGTGIDPARPPAWRSMVMPSDDAINGHRVIGTDGFFPDCLSLPFLFDMSEELDGFL